ncbi:MAG: AMP-binding protein, partial [Myxococcota bacterium]
EKVRMRVMQQAASASWLKSRLVAWAVEKSAQHAQRVADGQAAGLWDRMTLGLASTLVLEKIGAQLRERFGGKMRFFVSGGAPLSKKVGQFFEDVGVVICEGYGLTETTAPICFNLPYERRIGTVGKVMPGTQLRIAADGEILVRGDAVFQGYWNQPQNTKEMFNDGWLCTGDVGHIDQDDFVCITDRKKDIIVTAGGKNIAPQKIEMAFKAQSPLIGYVVAYGDKKPFLTALMVLEEETLLSWAAQRKIKGSYQELTQHALVRKAIEKSVSEVNAQLPRHEQIKRFCVLDHDLVVGKQLTPTLKVKRSVCYELYKDQFNKLYV